MSDFPIGYGRYTLVERLAVGGMAELFVATAPGEHGFTKRVVIKRLLPHLQADDTYKAMFIDEAKLTARLVHPKIAQTFELGRVDDSLYIAMEHVDGIDVLALLREFAAKKRRIEPQLAAWIAHEILDALDYAHNLRDESGKSLGIVHRDISPSNVLLSMRGDIKLVDFGIARAIDPERAHKSKTGTLKGKYGYMSPEQVLEMPLDGRSDVFSVGVVLAELLTGRRLFAAPNELDVLLMVRDAKLGRFDKYGADLEAGLATIVRTALKKPLDERYPSAAAFRDAIGEWLFEHRHRMTSRHVATVVGELHEAVLQRRQRTVNAIATGTPAVDDVMPPRPDDSAPLAIDQREDVSMPVISMTYDADQVELRAPPAAPQSAPSGKSRPIAIQVPPVIARQPTGPSPLPVIPPPPVGAPPVSDGPPVIARVPTPRELANAAATAGADPGVVEIPIADTISGAIAGISLPEPELPPIAPKPAPPPAAPADDPVFNVEEDSISRAFDDLTEDPPQQRSREVVLPSKEELARKRPPTPPHMTDIAEPADDAGDFANISPLRVLFRLMTARATGLLVVAVGGIKKEIYVRDGQPEYVSSNVASELFGNYLVTKGVLSDGELAMALAMMPHYGGKLGDTLVGLGLLKPLEVFRHLTRQVRSKIIDVCTWNKGGFAWYAGRENPREAFPLDFNAFEILGAGAMAQADELVDHWISRNARTKLRAARSRRVGPERFEVKGLVDLFDALDGKLTVQQLLDRSTDPDERLRVGRMLSLLDACDLAKAS